MKAEIGFSKNDDGGFFMSFEDWVDQFESFTTCYITDIDGESTKNRDNRLIGTLVPGKNAGSDYFEKNLQLEAKNY